MKRPNVLIVGFALLECLLVSAFAQDSQNEEKPSGIRISGSVVDTAGKGIEGVEITIWPSSKKDSVKSTRTLNNGTYDVKITFTGAFDMIYNHTNFQIDSVALLSEAKEQTINKVMFHKGEKKVAALMGELEALERIHLMVAKTPQIERKEVVKKLESFHLWEEKIPDVVLKEYKFATSEEEELAPNGFSGVSREQ